MTWIRHRTSRCDIRHDVATELRTPDHARECYDVTNQSNEWGFKIPCENGGRTDIANMLKLNMLESVRGRALACSHSAKKVYYQTGSENAW
jgi:hypothetical protein